MRADPADAPAYDGDQACRRIARALLARYQWSLLSEEDLVAIGLDALGLGSPPAQLERQLITHYTLVLYDACRHAGDADRRVRGYTDLFHFLYRAANNRWPDLAEDVTQRALLLVYQQIDNCRKPAAFMQFALFKLWQAYGSEKPDSTEQPIDPTTAEVADAQPSQLTALIAKESATVLVDAVKDLPEAQQQTIVLKFFVGLSDAEIGQRLGVSAGHVRVMRFRGLERLRRDPRLQAYFAGNADSEAV